MVLNSLSSNRLVVQMIKSKADLDKITTDSILVAYPDEELFEDGELDEAAVEEKIIWLWRNGKIQIARWEKLNGR